MNSAREKMNRNLPIVGILGDGQLAMMMAQAYQRWGGFVYVLGATDSGPARGSADKIYLGAINDAKCVSDFFRR